MNPQVWFTLCQLFAWLGALLVVAGVGGMLYFGGRLADHREDELSRLRAENESLSITRPPPAIEPVVKEWKRAVESRPALTVLERTSSVQGRQVRTRFVLGAVPAGEIGYFRAQLTFSVPILEAERSMAGGGTVFGAHLTRMVVDGDTIEVRGSQLPAGTFLLITVITDEEPRVLDTTLMPQPTTQ